MKTYKLFLNSVLGISLLFPMLASAQVVTDINTLVQYILGIFQSAVFVIMGLALVVFLWGIMRFIMQAGNKEAVEEGKQLMWWGIIALFVMSSVWGLVNILGNSFFGPGGATTQPPGGTGLNTIETLST